MQWANVVCNVHKQMSALSKIIPPVLLGSAAHPLTIHVCDVYPQMVFLDQHVEAAVLVPK